MMKLKKIFVILILLMLPNVVLADGGGHSHIFSIEKFEVSGDRSKITLEGYSFISHQDNYGILNSKPSEGNLETYIVAYTGSWSSSFTSHSTCTSNANCYSKKMNAVSGRDFWYARCNGEGCLSSTKTRALNERVDTKKFVLDSSCNDYGSDNSGCLYSNVGFKGDIELNEIFEKFGNDSTVEIKFRIVSVIKQNPSNKKYKLNDSYNAVEAASVDGVMTVDSGLAVYGGVCKVGGSLCSVDASGNIDLSNEEFELKTYSWSDTVMYDATFSKGRKGIDAYNFTDSEFGYFRENKEYKILEYNGYVHPFTVGGFPFDDSIIKLRSKQSGMSYVYPSEACDNSTNAKEQRCELVPADYDVGIDYYSLSNFVVFKGELKIKGKVKIEEINCDDIISETEKNSITVNCSSEDTLYQCMEVRNDPNVAGVIYYKMSGSELSGVGSCANNSSYYYKDGSTVYLPINVFADVLVEQTGKFTFNDFTPNTVRAGKGFSINGNISYNNSVSWMVANKLNNKPYFTYSAQKTISSGGGCATDDSFNVNTILKSLTSDTNGKLYYKNPSGGMESLSTVNASLAVIDAVLNDNYFGGYDDVTNNLINDNISFKSCNSNSSDTDCEEVIVEGDIWGKEVLTPVDVDLDGTSTKFGVKRSSNYNYKLPYSYVASIDTTYDGITYKAGSVIYSETEISNYSDYNFLYTGNKYFVGFKYLYDDTGGMDFPYSIASDVNPSLISGMNWTLNGTCGVEVEEGYYKCPSGTCDGGTGLELTYNYRPISLSNPFPKTIPSNWATWYGDTSNQNRISNTIDNGIKYQTTITKAQVGSIAGGDYAGLTGIENDGTSEFVTSNFPTRETAGHSYCGLGIFEPSCDQL